MYYIISKLKYLIFFERVKENWIFKEILNFDDKIVYNILWENIYFKLKCYNKLLFNLILIYVCM